MGAAGAAFVSDWFIDALDPAVSSLGISKAFAGLVIVGIAGNAVEHVTSIFLAAKRRSDVAISVVKNSAAQVAAFLFPALVLISIPFDTSLTFAIPTVYIGALFVTAIASWQITGDGEARMFEGVALVAIYVVLAALHALRLSGPTLGSLGGARDLVPFQPRAARHAGRSYFRHRLGSWSS